MKIVLGLLLMLLVSCSARDFVVKNADSFLSYQITKRIPLHSEQKDILKKDIIVFLKETKPKAKEFLPVLDEIYKQDPAKLAQQYERLESFYRYLTSEFAELLAVHLAKLDQKQQAEMFETLEEENRVIRKQDKKELREKVEERLEQILGSVNKKQKSLISRELDFFAVRNKERLARRLKLQQELKMILKSNQSQESKKVAIFEAFNSYQRETLKGNRNLELLNEITPTLSQAQREKFRQSTREVKNLIKYYLTVDY